MYNLFNFNFGEFGFGEFSQFAKSAKIKLKKYTRYTVFVMTRANKFWMRWSLLRFVYEMPK